MNYKFELPNGKRKPIIKVIGVGGGGSNAVNYMFQQGIQDVDFWVCNTDAQALRNSPIENKLQIGSMLTEGLGAGTNPDMGKQSALEDKERIRELLVDTKMVFITAGMGGGTGTGAAPVIAKIAKEMDVLTVGIITMPFVFEGKKKMLLAEAGINELKQYCDTVIIILNDKIKEIYGNLFFKEAFSKADDILTMAAKSIADIITDTGEMNIDFQDVKMVMKSAGTAVMGSAIYGGKDRAIKATQAALDSPLINNTDISGAKKILVSITTNGENFTMDEFAIINKYLQETAGEDALLKSGVSIDASLEDNIRVTVIATGFENSKSNSLEIPTKIIELESQKTIITKYPTKSEEQIIVDTNDGIFRNVNSARVVIPNDTKPNVVQSTLFTSEHEKAIVSDYQEINEEKKKKQEEVARTRITKISERTVVSSIDQEELRKMFNEPAYMRTQKNLYEPPHSSERVVSKFSLNEDGDVLGNNKFLHDNVD